MPLETPKTPFRNYTEVNFDGIVGPTHNYSGLSPGNVASAENEGRISSPLAACIQGLNKAYMLAQLGVPQAMLPAQERPYLQHLYTLGYRGTPEEMIGEVDKTTLSNLYSTSSMWTANAATVAPSVDTRDGRIHVVPANLHYQFHRSLEAIATMATLQKMLGDIATMHTPLPGHVQFGDEGAANHMRFAPEHGEPGVHLFAYGTDGKSGPKKNPARQTRVTSEALARLLQIRPDRVVFAQKSPEAIDAGVFHNDVISTNNGLVWLLHEAAYTDTKRVVDDVQQAVRGDLYVAMAKTKDLSLDDVVHSYVFNSQIVTLPDGSMILIAPTEAQKNPRARAFIEKTLSDPKCPISKMEYVDLGESMRNGGGPACLRLRIVMSETEKQQVRGRVFLDDALYGELIGWAKRNYRDRMIPDDLRDPNLLRESTKAMRELRHILKI